MDCYNVSRSDIILLFNPIYGYTSLYYLVTVVINITFRTAADRFDFLAILPFEVRNVVFVIPFFVIDYFWELINLEFLIFGRMGIIEDPLLKGDISADKIKKPADLFMFYINKSLGEY